MCKFGNEIEWERWPPHPGLLPLNVWSEWELQGAMCSFEVAVGEGDGGFCWYGSAEVLFEILEDI